MRTVIACVVCLALLPAPAPVLAADTGEREAQLQDALVAFDSAVAIKSRSGPEAQRLFRRALDGFLFLMNDGVHSAALQYDAANTYLRLGEVGHAIVQYRRALRLEPGNEKIRKNLQVARNMCETQFSKPASSSFIETLLFWHFGWSMNSRARVFLISYTVFWGLLLITLLARRRGAAIVWMVLLSGGIAMLAGASIGWDRLWAAQRPEGVLVADRVVLRKGNGDYYDPQFDRPLSEGVECLLLEERRDVGGSAWYHVELPDGKNGWLRADRLEVI